MGFATQGQPGRADGEGEALCYERLEQPWHDWARIARNFGYQVEAQDRDDLMHNIILRLAEVADEYRRQGKALTRWGCIRVAQYTRLRFYRDKRRWARMCPSTLGSTMADDGRQVETADRRASTSDIDWDAWLDAKRLCLKSPQRTRKAIDKLLNENWRELSGYDWRLIKELRRQYQMRGSG